MRVRLNCLDKYPVSLSDTLPGRLPLTLDRILHSGANVKCNFWKTRASLPYVPQQSCLHFPQQPCLHFSQQ